MDRYCALETERARWEPREQRLVDQLDAVTWELADRREGRGGVVYTSLQDQLGTERQLQVLTEELHTNKAMVSSEMKEKEEQEMEIGELRAEVSRLRSRARQMGQLGEKNGTECATGTTPTNIGEIPGLKLEAPVFEPATETSTSATCGPFPISSTSFIWTTPKSSVTSPVLLTSANAVTTPRLQTAVHPNCTSTSPAVVATAPPMVAGPEDVPNVSVSTSTTPTCPPTSSAASMPSLLTQTPAAPLYSLPALEPVLTQVTMPPPCSRSLPVSAPAAVSDPGALAPALPTTGRLVSAPTAYPLVPGLSGERHGTGAESPTPSVGEEPLANRSEQESCVSDRSNINPSSYSANGDLVNETVADVGEIRLLRPVKIPARFQKMVLGKVIGPEDSTVMFTPEVAERNVCMEDGVLEVGDGRCVVLVVENRSKQSVQLEEGMKFGTTVTAEVVSGVEVVEEAKKTPNGMQVHQITTGGMPDDSRLAQLLAHLELPTEHLTQGQQEQLEELLISYADTFALGPNELGTTELVKHVIDTGGHPPVRRPVRRTPFALRSAVEGMVQDMMEQGVVEPSISPWASPVVLVRKKDGGIWFCVNF